MVKSKKYFWILGFILIAFILIAFFDGASASTGEVIFVSPTPAEGSVFTNDSFYVNMTTNIVGDSYSFVDFVRAGSKSDILGWWKMEGSPVADSSSNENVGSLKYDAKIVPGKFGNAVSLDGNKDYVSLGNLKIFDRIQNFTISLWVNPSINQGGYQSGLFSSGLFYSTNKNDKYEIKFRGGQGSFKILFEMGDGTSSDILGTSMSMVPDQWNHVACGVDETNKMFCYVNGELGGTKQKALTSTVSAYTTSIGSLGSMYSLNGSLDEVLFFDRAISSEEVKALYDSNNNYEKEFTGLKEGVYDIIGYATDSEDNIYSNWREVILSFPGVPPEVDIVSPQENEIITSDFLSVLVNLNEYGKNVLYSFDEGITKVPMITEDNLTYVANLENLTEGDYDLRVYAEDFEGNINGDESVAFTILTSPTPIIKVFNSNSARMVPHTVHVHATDSLNFDRWERSKFSWNFDSDKQENEHLKTTDPRTGERVDIATKQQGFNAAYIYREPGNYTITLQATSEYGDSYYVSEIIEILPDTRIKRYVSSSEGNDSNNGSIENPWKTLGYTSSQIDDEMAFYFKRGDTFNLPESIISIVQGNVLFDAYGDESIERPVFYKKWENLSLDTFIRLTSSSENVLIKTIKFDTNMPITDTSGRVIEPQGRLQTIWDIDFYGDSETGFNRLVSMTDEPRGVLVLNCFSANSAGTKFPTEGNDFVFIGLDINVSAGAHGHTMRNLGARNDRVNVEWVNFIGNGGSDNDLIRFQTVKWGHIYHSNLLEGRVKISHDEYDVDYIVVDGNILRNGGFNALTFSRNANNVFVKNNIFEVVKDSRGYARAAITRGSGCQSNGYYTIENVAFANNLFLREENNPASIVADFTDISGVGTKGCVFETDIINFEFINNLVVSEDESRILTLGAGDDVREVSNNVYPEKCLGYKCFNLGGTGMNLSLWNFLSINNNEQVENVSLVDLINSDYRPDYLKYPISTSNAKPVPGVFEDFYENKRKGETLYVGAVDAATCKQQEGTVCGKKMECSGKWLVASNSLRCCSLECVKVEKGMKKVKEVRKVRKSMEKGKEKKKDKKDWNEEESVEN